MYFLLPQWFPAVTSQACTQMPLEESLAWVPADSWICPRAQCKPRALQSCPCGQPGSSEAGGHHIPTAVRGARQGHAAMVAAWVCLLPWRAKISEKVGKITQENEGRTQIEEGILEEVDKCPFWVEERKVPCHSKLAGQRRVTVIVPLQNCPCRSHPYL